MNAEEIPVELRERDQWLVWRTEWREGKPTKVPYSADATSRAASTTTPSTWRSFKLAASAVRLGLAEGVGFVFSDEDPFAGIDLDGCASPETGRLAEWAAEIVRLLDSYTERSPSGSGVHVIVRGSLPDGRRRRGGVELYDRGRYFTVTGDRLPGSPATVQPRQAQLDAAHARVFPPAPLRPAAPASGTSSLDDRELLGRALAARNGGLFRDLWEGRWQARYGSHSEADLALCGLLAFWAGGDHGTVDRLFRASGLMRAKWDRDDYRQATLGRAVEGRSGFYTPPVGSVDLRAWIEARR